MIRTFCGLKNTKGSELSALIGVNLRLVYILRTWRPLRLCASIFSFKSQCRFRFDGRQSTNVDLARVRVYGPPLGRLFFSLLSISQGLIENPKYRLHRHTIRGFPGDIANSLLKPLVWWKPCPLEYQIRSEFEALTIAFEYSLCKVSCPPTRKKPVDIYFGCVRMRRFIQKDDVPTA